MPLRFDRPPGRGLELHDPARGAQGQRAGEDLGGSDGAEVGEESLGRGAEPRIVAGLLDGAFGERRLDLVPVGDLADDPVGVDLEVDRHAIGGEVEEAVEIRRRQRPLAIDRGVDSRVGDRRHDLLGRYGFDLDVEVVADDGYRRHLPGKGPAAPVADGVGGLVAGLDREDHLRIVGLRRRQDEAKAEHGDQSRDRDSDVSSWDSLSLRTPGKYVRRTCRANAPIRRRNARRTRAWCRRNCRRIDARLKPLSTLPGFTHHRSLF